MKLIINILALIALVAAYVDIDDKIHFEDIISDPAKLEHQVLCYLDKGPCNELEQTHKNHMTEAVNTDCAKCTPTHKHNAKVFYHGVEKLFPALLQELHDKYDPDNKHYGFLTEVEHF